MYLYSTVRSIRDRKGNRENAQASSRWLWGNSWYLKEPLGRISEGHQSFSKATESSRVELRRPEHCLLVMATEFKLSEATLVCTFVALHSIRRLVIPFAAFRISTMNIYILVSIYYVFLERVGMKLIDDYPVDT